MRSTTISCLCLMATAAAQAGRPLTTEDAGVLDRGDCEWETVAGRERSTGSPHMEAWATQAACGIGIDTQVAASYGQARAAGSTESNVFVGGKTLLAAGGDSRPALAFAYGVALLKQVPVDTRFRFDSAFANLALTAPLAEAWTGHANLGAAYHRDQRVTHATWALAIEQDIGDSLGWGLETFGEHADRPWVGTGLRWDASPALNLNIAVATQRGRPHASFISMGAKFAF